MPKQIYKHLKATYKCRDCRKKFTKRFVVLVNANFSINEVSTALAQENKIKALNICSNCNSTSITVSYTFYHEEKLTNHSN